MLLPIKPVCKKNKVRRDGTSLIFIQYCYSSEKRTVLSTGIAIPPAYWKRSRIADNLPPEYGEAGHLNAEVARMLRIAEDIVGFAVKNKASDPMLFLKNTFQPDFDPKTLTEQPQKIAITQSGTNLDFFYQLDQFIESKVKKVSAIRIKGFRDLKYYLEVFEQQWNKKLTFNHIDFNFYEDFVDFLTYDYQLRGRLQQQKGLRINSIGKTIRLLVCFLLDRARRKIIAPIDMTGFESPNEETDAIYLNWEEIHRIYTTDLTAYPNLIAARNLFLLGCLTGLRFSDYSTISPEDVRNGMIYKKQEKSDHWVVIPLRNEAYDILVNHFHCNVPYIDSTNFNKQIKKIGELAGLNEPIRFSYKKGNKDVVDTRPKYGWITSHTCRRSFCTNEFLAGTPVDLIMKLSGHKKTESFYRYIRITPEEAGNKIKELWEQRGQMAVFEKAV